MDALTQSIDDLVARRLADSFESLDPQASFGPLRTADAVDVVVPIHDAYDVVCECLSELVAHTGTRHRLVLIDDASSDSRIWELLSSLAERYPHVDARRQTRNLGYLQTVNRAIRASSRDVVLLNSDARVGPEWLDRLARAAHSAPHIGIACPLSDDATLVSVVGGDQLRELNPAARQALCINSAAGIYPRLPVAAGFCMYIRRAMFDAIGEFDCAFDPGYGEETDFSLRAWQAGFEIVACPDVLVTHRSGSSFGHSDEIRRRRLIHERLMAARWPGYEALVREWWREWPLRQQSERIAASRSDARTRALHVAHALARLGGTELHARALVRQLARHLDVALVAPEQMSLWQDAGVIDRGDGWEERFVNRRYHVANQRFLGVGADLSDPGVERQFLRTVVGGDFRIVHFHSLLHWNSLLLPLLAQAAGACVVLTLHSLEALCPNFTMAPPPSGKPCNRIVADARSGCVECLGQVHRVRAGVNAPDPGTYLAARRHLWSRILNAADALIAPSQFVLNRIVSAYGEAVRERAHIVPHGIAAAIRQHAKRAPSETLVVGFFGGQAQGKGIDLVLKLAARLTDAPIRFIVRGIHARHELPAELAANIGWHGPFLPEQLSDVLAEIDVLLLPAQAEETFSLLLSESLAAGVPVIASRRGALAERVDDERNGWLRDPEDLDAWIELLRRLSSPMGREAIRTAAESCARLPPRSMRENADDYWRIYEKLLASEPQNRVKNRTSVAHSIESSSSARLRTNLLGAVHAPPRWLDRAGPHARHSADRTRLHVTVQVERHNLHLLARTLESARVACVQSIAIVVAGDIALDEIDTSFSDDAHRVLRADGAAFYESFVAEIGRAQADWFAYLDAGDGLCASATQCLDHLERPEADAIVTDFDLVDERNHHYSATVQPNWDVWRALGDSAYTNALFVSARFMRVIGGWPRPIGGSRLAMQLALRHHAASVTRVGRVLIHVADVNVSPRQRDVIRDEDIRVVRRALEPAGWRIRDRGALPGWSVAPAMVGSPNIAVVLWGHREIPTGAVADLATHLRWPALVSCSTGLMTELPEVDYILFWRYGAAPADDSMLAMLVGWIQQPRVAAVAPRRAGSDRRMLPRSYTFDGASLQFDADPAVVAAVVGDGAVPTPCSVPALPADCLLVRRDVLTCDMLTCIAAAENVDAWRAQQLWQQRGDVLLSIPDAVVDCAWAPVARGPELRAASAEAARALWLQSSTHARERMRHLKKNRAGLSSAGIRKIRPRFAVLTRDDAASSQYRVHLPLQDLLACGAIDAPVVWRLREEEAPGPFDVLAEQADGLILHHCFDDRSIEVLRFFSQARNGPRIVVLDDFITGVPAYNPAGRHLFADIAERLRTVLALSTCLVVTSSALAEAYGKWAPNTMIIENALPDSPWAHLMRSPPRVRADGRLRVGWAGAEQHAGDLALIEELVHRRRDVQWVFMGMAARGAVEAGAEFHRFVPFREYPERLAELDLDIALAPLADNMFNRCKSALKVLELGALGIPVIASDLRPYRNTPAVLAANGFEPWNAALDGLLSEPDARTAKGAELREWVWASQRISHRRPLWSQALQLDHAG